jgi:predicted nuclease with TOPRIM domain
MALDVSLAHNELRAMLDAVYGEMDALRHQVQALREENARLEEEVGRRQEELARAADVRGNDATCLERELLDAKQQHQTLSARHVRGFVCESAASVSLLVDLFYLTTAGRAGGGVRTA